MNDFTMTRGERRATWALGSVFSLRMLGMFMVLPVLTTYGMSLAGASEALIGLAIGIYGMTQALFQIPFGLLSDKVGRKPLIIGGLLVFALGSVIAALTHSIWGVILGRALQGSGAISAAVMALLSDLTREQNRTKAMAFIGVSFGITFAIAMVTGPPDYSCAGTLRPVLADRPAGAGGHRRHPLAGADTDNSSAQSRVRHGQGWDAHCADQSAPAQTQSRHFVRAYPVDVELRGVAAAAGASGSASGQPVAGLSGHHADRLRQRCALHHLC